jgi:hypothetical protein
MSEDRPVTLEFLAAQSQRVLAELRILRDHVDVLAATCPRIDNSFDRLETRLLAEFREILAMHAQHDRTAGRVRALEERQT